MLRPLLVLLLLIALLPSTPGCGRTQVIKVPYPVEIRHPPCLGAAERPPVPPAGTTPADEAWADYYGRLVAWSWSAWRRCAPEGAAS